MEPQQIFLIIWFVIVTSICYIFFISGKRILKRFQNLESSNFEFEEFFASGYSTQSFKTKMGGTRGVLRIHITENALWITTHPFMAFIANKFDLLQKIPTTSLKSVSIDKKKSLIEFNKNGITKKIVLFSKKQNELVKILNDKIEKARQFE